MKKYLKLLLKDLLIFIGYFLLSGFLISIVNSLFHFHSETTYLIAELLTSFITCLILYYRYKKDIKDCIKSLKTINLKKYILIYLIAFISVYFINNIIYEIIKILPSNEINTRNIIMMHPVISFISVCFIAPFSEEIIIRLNFKNLFKSKWKFTIIMGLFFASLHLLNIQNYLELFYLISYFILGSTLSYIYYDSNNILLSIFIHFCNNIIQFILILGGIL